MTFLYVRGRLRVFLRHSTLPIADNTTTLLGEPVPWTDRTILNLDNLLLLHDAAASVFTVTPRLAQVVTGQTVPHRTTN